MLNRSLTAIFAALEALLVAGVGIGIPLVPLTVLWGAQYGFATGWLVFWRASIDTWLLGHGVDLHVALDEGLATSVGIAPTESSFWITIAPLGFASVTVLLAVRAGRRVAETRHRELGTLVAVGTFCLISLLVTASASHSVAEPSLAQGLALPTLVFLLGFAIGLVGTKRAAGDDSGSSLRDWIDDWSPSVRASIVAALRGGGAVVALIVAVGSVVVAVLLAVNYAKVISLYEGLHTGALGGSALTIGELAFMPNLVIWASSWLVGPGFAIGTGSSVGPLATHLGPVPAVPFLGALPTGDFAFGFLGLLAPVIAGFLVAAVLRQRVLAQLDVERPGLWLAATGLGVGVVAGLVLGLLAWWSGGAAGPGRLMDVGPDPVAVALFAALETGAAAALGFTVARRR